MMLDAIFFVFESSLYIMRGKNQLFVIMNNIQVIKSIILHSLFFYIIRNRRMDNVIGSCYIIMTIRIFLFVLMIIYIFLVFIVFSFSIKRKRKIRNRVS